MEEIEKILNVGQSRVASYLNVFWFEIQCRKRGFKSFNQSDMADLSISLPFLLGMISRVAAGIILYNA